jgi:hypothetical protein|nr:MAG TPA: Nuclear pore complex protein Nup54, coiled-coil, nuclear pore complex.8A [Caudoviricetes sp.]
MIFNQGTDTTLEPAYFARVQNSDVMGKYEGRIRELEEQQKETTATITTIQSKDTEQDNKLVELEEEIVALGDSCKCDPMSPISSDVLDGLTFSTQI